MLFRLILAAAMSKLGQEILIDLYKRYIKTTPRNLYTTPSGYFSKDNNR